VRGGGAQWRDTAAAAPHVCTHSLDPEHHTLKCSQLKCLSCNDVLSFSSRATLEGLLNECIVKAPPKPSAGKRRGGGNVCSFYLAGSCTRGSACRFAHSGELPQCSLGASCTLGDDCVYRHDPAPAGAGEQRVGAIVTAFEWSKGTGDVAPDSVHVHVTTTMQRMVAWRGESNTHTLSHTDRGFAGGRPRGLLLVGENNLTFSSALLSILSSSFSSSSVRTVFIPTVFEGHEKAVSVIAPAKLQRFGIADTNTTNAIACPGVLFGVDATQLHTAGSPIRQYLHSTDLSIVYWNFPFTGEDDNIAAQKQLLLGFFFSVSAMIAGHDRMSAAPPRIWLTLCNDQAARWDLSKLAMSQLFYLSNSWPFQVGDFPGYGPCRNGSSELFPVTLSVTYEFTFHEQLADSDSC
jgi:hypothetical protein